MSTGVLFYGDPHGDWRPLFRAAKEHEPEAVAHLGDMDLEMLLRQQLAPLFDAGISVRWIPGNLDLDRQEWYDRLFEDHTARSIHATWVPQGGMIIAGLGGIFKGRIWYPQDGREASSYSTRRVLLRKSSNSERFRNGLPLG